MEYSVSALAKLSGVTPRTLRYYDKIGLLLPGGHSSSGYRIYGPEQVDALQRILFCRELGMSLSQITKALECPDTELIPLLEGYRGELLQRRQRLSTLIENVEKTIEAKKGVIEMKDEEKFEGFKKGLIEENERRYGAEIREKYGEDEVNESNRRLMNLSQQDYSKMQDIAEELLELLRSAVLEGTDPGGEAGQKAALLHKSWLSYSWPSYSPEAHLGLVTMYVEDERFKAYYDSEVEGCAAFLKEAVTLFLAGQGE